MRRARRSALLLAPVLVLAAACNTVVNGGDSRVAAGDTVTVTQGTGFPAGPNTSTCPADADVEVFIDDVVAGTGTSDVSGSFSIEITAPTTPESYEVHAECTVDAPTEEDPEATATTVLNPAQLIVEPELVLGAEPQEVVAGDTFAAVGNFCVSESPTGTRPIADITFEDETLQAVADGAQPFEETFSLELTAPTEPGTYEITGTCTYDDTPEAGFGFPPLEPEGVEAAAAVSVEYPIAEVVVVAVPEEPVTPPTPPAPTPAPEAPRSPAAQPTTAAPTYTG
jgi:hypothetical protein